MNDITPKEAIANLNHIYGMVAPDIQRSLDVAIKALERPQVTVFTESTDEKAIENMKAELQSVIDARPKGEWRDNLIEVFRQSAEVGGDMFHLSEIERIINGEPI